MPETETRAILATESEGESGFGPALTGDKQSEAFNDLFSWPRKFAQEMLSADVSSHTPIADT